MKVPNMNINNLSMDTLVEYLASNDFAIEEDNEGQVVIYTGLYQLPDGGLDNEHPDDRETA